MIFRCAPRVKRERGGGEIVTWSREQYAVNNDTSAIHYTEPVRFFNYFAFLPSSGWWYECIRRVRDGCGPEWRWSRAQYERFGGQSRRTCNGTTRILISPIIRVVLRASFGFRFTKRGAKSRNGVCLRTYVCVCVCASVWRVSLMSAPQTDLFWQFSTWYIPGDARQNARDAVWIQNAQGFMAPNDRVSFRSSITRQ